MEIEGARTYPAGFAEDYDFELPVPRDPDDGPTSGIGGAILEGLSMLSNRRSYVDWKVEIQLDAKGIDLAGSKRVSVG